MHPTSSLRRKHYDFGLIRMTNSGRPSFGLAKVVRRRVEVLHVSRDGEVALLGILIKGEDTVPLVVGEEGREWLRQTPLIFKCANFRPHTNQNEKRVGDIAEVGRERENTSNGHDGGAKSVNKITNLDKIMGSVATYSPTIWFALGQDLDGVLRFMGFTRITPTGGISDGDGSSSLHVPIFNIRIGPFKCSKEMPYESNGNPQTTRACMWWLLEGDDEFSRNNPWRFKEAAGKTGPERARAASSGFQILTSYFTRLFCSPHPSCPSNPKHMVQWIRWQHT